MSMDGMKVAAEVYNQIALARHQLLHMGAKDPASKSGYQDFLLAHLLEKMNEVTKDDFSRITSGTSPEDL